MLHGKEYLGRACVDSDLPMVSDRLAEHYLFYPLRPSQDGSNR